MSEYYYIDKNNLGFQELAESARQWNIEMTQLSCGKSINMLKQLSLARAKMNFLLLNGHKTTVGDPPASGRTFAFFSGERSELVWRKKKMRQNELMIFPCGAEHDVMTKGENLQVYTITLPETVWSLSLPDREAEAYFKLMSSQERIRLTPDAMSQLKYLVDSSFNTIGTTPEILDQKKFRENIEEQLFYAITRTLSPATNCNSSLSRRKKTHKSWDKIDAIIKKKDNSLISVTELRLAAGVSERSLRRIFYDRYGLSPKQFLNRVRLNKVRRDLMIRPSGISKIADIANNYGFWHMGQFAADYKTLFGELPSQTPRLDL